ncbi:MAG: Ig-like domain-containing protein [Flavobacterium sp.]|nr:Ig-like domain-containing protein [Flavobacterium sp.]
MKIISLKLKITTFLLLFLACHGVLAQKTAENLKSGIENNDDLTTELTTSIQKSNRLLPPVITGNFSICLPGPTTTQLTASLPPAAVTPTTPWVSSNPAVATISSTGLVTQVALGATTITYTDNLGNTYSENVYVSLFPSIATTFGTSTCAGGTLQIDGSLFPNPITPWISLTPAIASVDSSGLITGISGGSATIQYMNLGGCTTTTPITINPLLIPTVTCGVTTTDQITFNWNALAGATTYVRSYQIGAGPFQSAGSGSATTYTLTGLLPSTTVTFYVAPSGSVGSCFQVGQVTCSTLPCDAVTTPVAPTIGVITQPSCILATGSVAISGLPAGNWTLNQTGTTANTIAGNTATTTISGLATGSYSFTVLNNFGCTSLASVNVNIAGVPPIPAAPISTGNITQCQQLPIQTLDANNAITVIPGQTISWYTLAVGGVLVASPTLNTPGTVTYFAQAFDGTCSSVTRTAVTLTITGAPAAPISTGNITQCQQLPIQTLNANTAITIIPGQTISWYTLAVGGVLVPTPTLNTVGTITYFAQANDGTCDSTTRTPVTLTITGAPAAPISTGNITQCQQLPIQTLNANNAITVIPGQTISWYTLAVGGVLVASPTLNTVGTATYFAQANDGTCDSTTRTSVTLTITGAPAAPISTGNITQCQQLPIQTLNANNAITVIPGQTISWYTLAVGGVLVATPTLSAVGTITYFAQANDGTCDSTTRTSVTLTITGAPAAPISTGNITQCQQLPIQTLNANNAITVIPGQTISWYTLAVGGVLVAAPTLNTVGTVTYFAQANDGTCDSTTRTSVTLTITGPPAAPISTGNITECEQLPIQILDANNAITVIPGQTISWYTLAVGGVLVASPTLNTVGTITYFAQANDGTCDSTTRTSVTLTITGAPAAPISTGNITQCQQLPIQTLNANNAITVIPGQTISWYTLAVGGVLVPTPTLNTVGTITYFAQGNDGTCDSLTRTSVTLTITGAPAAPISTGNITQCVQLPIQTLDANNAITVIPGQTISWYSLAVGGVLGC